jgi:hypothetical protein
MLAAARLAAAHCIYSTACTVMHSSCTAHILPTFPNTLIDAGGFPSLIAQRSTVPSKSTTIHRQKATINQPAGLQPMMRSSFRACHFWSSFTNSWRGNSQSITSSPVAWKEKKRHQLHRFLHLRQKATINRRWTAHNFLSLIDFLQQKQSDRNSFISSPFVITLPFLIRSHPPTWFGISSAPMPTPMPTMNC